MDGYQKITLLIAFISLAVSLITLWWTRLSPAKISARLLGRLDLIGHPAPQTVPLISLPVLFYNSGARLGVVEDLFITLKPTNKNNLETLAFRVLYDQSAGYNFAITSNVQPPDWQAFHGFGVKPGEALVKKLVFIQYGVQAGTKFSEGRFSLCLHAANKLSNSSLEKLCCMNIEITPTICQTIHPEGTVAKTESSKGIVHSILCENTQNAFSEFTNNLKKKVEP